MNFKTDASKAWFLSWPDMVPVQGKDVKDSPIAAEFCPISDESPDDVEAYGLVWFHFRENAEFIRGHVQEGHIAVRGVRIDDDGNRTFA